MPTVNNLIDKGCLLRWDLSEDDERLPGRTIAIHPDFVAWLDNTCPQDYIDRTKAMTPVEQVIDALDRLSTDESFPVPGNLVNVIPTRASVYEIKTADTRIFGFFPRKGQFVAVAGDLKQNLKDNITAAHDIRKRVTAVCKELGLDAIRHKEGIKHDLL